jgi:hypothetical protein
MFHGLAWAFNHRDRNELNSLPVDDAAKAQHK